jgi:hypothetical protein
MKTFNCTQCGASIKRISLKDRWAHCDYCKARFLLPEEKRPIVTGLTFGVITAGDSDDDGPESGRIWIAAACVLGVALVVFSGIKYQGDVAREEALKAEKAKETRLREEYVTNVPVSVEWDGGADDVLHYELPAVNTTTFALARRLEKAPSSRYVVVVQVKLDQEGKASEVEAVTGNIMLQQFATKAARATFFSPRSKKKKRKITYTFG